MEYHEVIRQRFLEPLDLERFSLFPYEPYQGTLTHLWLDFNGNGTATDAHSYFSVLRSSFSAGWAAGAYYANSTDLARWIKDFFTEDLFEPATLEDAMTTIPTAFPAGSRYGLGLIQRNFLGLTTFGHGGDIGFSANAFYFPDKNIAISTNCNDGTIHSWILSAVVRELLRVYIDCEALVTETNEVNQDLKARISPNPASTTITIELNFPDLHAADGFIYDVNGQIMAHFQTENMGQQHVQIDCSSWPAGVYLCSIKLKGGQVVKGKVLKL